MNIDLSNLFQGEQLTAIKDVLVYVFGFATNMFLNHFKANSVDLEVYQEVKKLLDEKTVDYFRYHYMGESHPYEVIQKFHSAAEDISHPKYKFLDKKLESFKKKLSASMANLSTLIATHTFPLKTLLEFVKVYPDDPIGLSEEERKQYLNHRVSITREMDSICQTFIEDFDTLTLECKRKFNKKI